MKPRTRNEKEVDRLAKSLPALTGKQLKWISRNAIPATAYQFGKEHQAWCSNCGHTFDDTHKQGKCPHCGAKFTEHKHSPRKQVEKSKWYTTIVTTCGGWQVNRHFMVEHYCAKGGYQDQDIYEAVQIWTNEKGEQVINARSVHMSCLYRDVWNFNSELSIKHKPAQWQFGYQRYDISSHANMVCRVLPIIRRNGFDGQFHDIAPDDLFRLILTDNFAETLLKTKQYGLLGLMLTSRGMKRDIAKVCVRHGYIIKSKDAILWRDYINMCEELGKDVHNPQVCCPADLKAAHDDAVGRIERMREAERRREEAERKRRDKEAAKAYPERMGKFFGLMITGTDISIRVLQSVDEFKEEGDAMHHCVFTNSYYKKVDSLILTARDAHGNRLETIEIDLKSFKIIQSRGICNQDSPKHKEIVKLMNAHMGDVKRLARPKTKRQAKTTQIAAAA